MNQSHHKTTTPITAVIGLGRSGIAAAKLLQKEGKKVLVIEKSYKESYKSISEELKQLGIYVELGKSLEVSSFQPWLQNISEVIISPSIPWDHPTINQLRILKIEIKGEISLAWEKLNHIPWIGITGTNGKTTVTHMLKHILDESNIKSGMGGNVGKPASQLALDYLNNEEAFPEWLIMELSSYQIEAASEIAPDIGIWTTFTKDHLERHKTMSNYFKIKKSLLDKSSIKIYNLDDKRLKAQRENLNKGIWVSAVPKDSSNSETQFWINKEGMVCEKEEKLFNSSILKLLGKHNLQNLLLATAAARSIGISAKTIEKSLSSFKGIPHRLEYLGEIEKINFFNDSKATNYDSASIGIQALRNSSIILAGGEAKKGDYTEWLGQLQKKSCGIFLFGSSASYLLRLIKDSGYKHYISTHKNLREASSSALKRGLEIKVSNILLSPACASFDQYKDFEERGNHFKELFKEFKLIESTKQKVK